MNFEPSYFNAEDRDGFHISSMVKRGWAVQLEILHQVDIICKRHNIMYYAECGTLLGAVRHNGFIPWDDDLDIGMRRVDYTRFLHYAKTELPEDFHIITVHSNSDYNQLICRIVNTLNLTTASEHLQKFHDFPYVTGIDIFITDNIPKDKNEETVQIQLLCAANSLALNWNENNQPANDISTDEGSVENATMEEKMELLKQIEELCHIKFDPKTSISQQLLALSDRICAMYWEDEPDEVSLLPDLALNPDFRFPVECYKSTIELPFENTTIPVPVGYDYILRKRYGEEYMTPVQSPSSHEYPFFRTQEEILFNEYAKRNLEIPSYLKE